MKRLLGCVSAGVAIAATPLFPAFAQAPAADKPEAIVCQLLDNCSDSAAAPETRPVRRGEVRGFSLARPKSAVSAGAPASSVSAPRPSSTGMATASRPKSKSKAAAAAAPHGQYDLRIAFITGSADVNPISRDQVSAFAAALKDPRLASRKVRIEGHTDSVGSAAKNQDLSQRRARAIADMLQAQGVDTSRLDVKGYGSSRPLPGTSASNGVNRRVVAVLEN